MNENKLKIIFALYELMTIYGYDKTTTRALCETADITKPTLYYYFKSKEEILIEVVKIMESRRLKEVEKVMDAQNVEEYKCEFLELGFSFIEGLMTDEKIRKVMFELSVLSKRIDSLNESLLKMHYKHVEDINKVINYGVELGCFKNASLLTSQMVLLTLDGIEYSILQEKNMNYKEIWKAMLEDQLWN